MTYEIICTPSGDKAEADTPEGAILAGITLIEDDERAMPIYGRKRSVAFLRVGDDNITRFIRSGVTKSDLRSGEVLL